MARKLRMEVEGAVYHVISRGNYRADVFRSDKTKEAFLKCLDEACTKAGWRVHAWCVMSNHYHLALETPVANLVDGMRWLQGTFAVRFNRLRSERGHLFQGRYKSLTVEPGEGLGPLCHYIHLNPVRARLCPIGQVAQWPWCSVHWLAQPKLRPKWFTPMPALSHAGNLADTPRGRNKYLEYLAWLHEDEPARKALHFETMSSGWAIGSVGFKKALLADHRDAAAALRRGDRETVALAEAGRQDALAAALAKIGKNRADLIRAGKSEAWKISLAATLKANTTATNRWLGENLHLGALHEVSRRIGEWVRNHQRLS
jgi:putative transposase